MTILYLRILLVSLLALMCVLPLSAQKKKMTAQDYAIRADKNLESNPNKALVDYEAALKLDTLFCSAYNSIASIKSQKNDYVAALKYYNKAVDCAKSMHDEQGTIMNTWNRAMYKHQIKDFEGALQDYESIIALNSSYTTGYTLSAFELLFLKKYDESEKRAKQVLTLSDITEDDKMTVERCIAHSLLLKGYVEKALEIHKKHQDYQFQFATWKVYIAQEFADFRKNGLPTQHLATIEKALGLPIQK